jgi:uncharacterized iron-regulated membrane protein
MRRWLLTLHLTVALVAGAFLLVLGITGSIMAFEVELSHVLNRQLWYVTPQNTRLSLAQLGEAASATPAAAGLKATGYSMSPAADLSAQVQFRGLTVYVNPYTGAVLGSRVPAPDFMSRVHQLHLRLLLTNKADSGKTIVSWAGVALLFLLASGLYLWWPLKRVTIQTRGSSRRFWLDLHASTGILSIAFLFLLAVTGVAIGFDEVIVPWLYRATGSAPIAMYGRPQIKPTSPVIAVGPDQAVAAAREALPGAVPVSVNVPAPGSVYAISARYPEDLTPGGRSRIYVDPATGRVLLAEGSRTAPAGTRLVTLNRAIHTGDVFGIPSKVIMSLASLMVVVQAVSGLVMWLKKR